MTCTFLLEHGKERLHDLAINMITIIMTMVCRLIYQFIRPIKMTLILVNINIMTYSCSLYLSHDKNDEQKTI